MSFLTDAIQPTLSTIKPFTREALSLAQRLSAIFASKWNLGTTLTLIGAAVTCEVYKRHNVIALPFFVCCGVGSLFFAVTKLHLFVLPKIFQKYLPWVGMILELIAIILLAYNFFQWLFSKKQTPENK